MLLSTGCPVRTKMNLILFQKNLEITLDKLALNNPFMLVVIRELNSTSKNWYLSDRTTYEGNIIVTISSHFGLHELVHDPTDILEKSSSCIDLIFASQPSMVVNLGVHSSLYANRHYQIVFAKFDIEIYYLPSYERKVWDYQEVDAICISWVIHEFSWKRTLSNLNVDEQVSVFNRTILNILKNFIPYESIVCDDKDPPWFNKRIKSLIQEGTLLLETFQKKRKNVEMINCLNNLNYRLAVLINTAKQNYYSKVVKKLQNTQRSSKGYLS